MSTSHERDDHGFAEAWRAFKAEEAMLSAPPSVYDAVMDACQRELERRDRPPEPRRRRRGYLSRRHGYLMMAAAALLVLAAAVGDVVERTAVEPVPLPLQQTPASAPGMPEFEPLQLVRVRMPREALQIFGVSLIELEAEGLVDVELIVADDGSARGIRSVTAVVDGVRQE